METTTIYELDNEASPVEKGLTFEQALDYEVLSHRKLYDDTVEHHGGSYEVIKGVMEIADGEYKDFETPFTEYISRLRSRTMYYRINEYLLNLHVVSGLHIFQPSSQSQATLYASDGGVDKPVFSGTREECEAKLADIQEAIRDFGSTVYGVEVEEVPEPEPEPEEVEESEDDTADEEE